MIWLFFLFTSTILGEECVDKSPYCNPNDCNVRPGYAREYCRNTCGNCTEFCQNSHFVSCKAERKPECDSMLKDYCPLLCGVCREPRVRKEKKAQTKAVKRGRLSSKALTFQPTTATETSATTAMVPIIPAGIEERTTQGQRQTFVMPPMFRPEASAEVRRAPARATARTPLRSRNAIDMPAEPLNIDVEADEDIEWVHDPSPTRVPAPTKRKTNATAVFLPELPEPQPILQQPIYYGNNQYSNRNNHNQYNQYNQNNQRQGNNWNPATSGYGSFPQPQTAYGPSMTQYNNIRRAPGTGINTQQQTSLLHPQYPQIDYNRSPSKPNTQVPYNQGPNPYQSAPYWKRNTRENPMAMTDLISLLGCRDRDPSTCSKITEETCFSRPGYYLKLCPVKCRNCNGLACYDSIKVDCEEVKRLGGCRLPTASEYCPRTCHLCHTPPALAESLSACKDELDSCEYLAESGVCDHPQSREALRIYCARSCGFCRVSQYYMNDTPYFKKQKDQKRYPSVTSKKN